MVVEAKLLENVMKRQRAAGRCFSLDLNPRLLIREPRAGERPVPAAHHLATHKRFTKRRGSKFN